MNTATWLRDSHCCKTAAATIPGSTLATLLFKMAPYRAIAIAPPVSLTAPKVLGPHLSRNSDTLGKSVGGDGLDLPCCNNNIKIQCPNLHDQDAHNLVPPTLNSATASRAIARAAVY